LSKKHRIEQQKHLCLQLVSFQAPLTGIVSAPSDSNHVEPRKQLSKAARRRGLSKNPQRMTKVNGLYFRPLIDRIKATTVRVAVNT